MSDSEQAKPIDVYEYMGFMLQSLSELAWAKLGLQPDMSTGKVEPLDLEQAKAAIDAADTIAGQLVPKLDDEDRRQVQNLMRDLRVNYMERAKG